MTSPSDFRHELAINVAELIVHDCMTWELARSHIRDCLTREQRQFMPASEEIESAVRETWELFYPEEHNKLLKCKRETAILVLELLGNFDAYLAGAVLNGCAGPETNIRIEVFCDDVKSIEVELMNQGIDFEAISPENTSMPEPLEALGFLLKNPNSYDLEGVRIEIFPTQARYLNPYKKKPDPWQKTWESAGRISKTALLSAISG